MPPRPISGATTLATVLVSRVHGITTQVNSIFNGWRLEEGVLDK